MEKAIMKAISVEVRTRHLAEETTCLHNGDDQAYWAELGKHGNLGLEEMM